MRAARLSAAICLACLSAYCRAEENISTLIEKLRSLAGSEAIACGELPLRVVDKSIFICATDAASTGQAFWVAFEFQGVDSFVWQGAASDGHGKQWLAVFDSYREEDHLSIWSCASLKFTNMGNAVKCEHAKKL